MNEPIQLLRDQVAGLLSQLDNAVKPRPTAVIKQGENRSRRYGFAQDSGAVWALGDDWIVRTVDSDPEGAKCVFLHGPYHWTGDYTWIPTDEARRLAMAMLAAADWADGLAENVISINARRDLSGGGGTGTEGDRDDR